MPNHALPSKCQTRGFVITGSKDGDANIAVRVGTRLVNIHIYTFGKKFFQDLSLTVYHATFVLS
jgi:hypothetical protein